MAFISYIRKNRCSLVYIPVQGTLAYLCFLCIIVILVSIIEHSFFLTLPSLIILPIAALSFHILAKKYDDQANELIENMLVKIFSKNNS